MNSLTDRKIKDSYKDLLHLSNNNLGMSSVLHSIYDGAGNLSPLKMSSTAISVDGELDATNLKILSKSVATQEWVNANVAGGLTNWSETNGHIIPNSNASFDLGNAEYKVRHLFLSDNSIWIGDDIKQEGGVKKKINKTKLPFWFSVNHPNVLVDEIVNWYNAEFKDSNLPEATALENLSLSAIIEFAKIKSGNQELSASDIYPSEKKSDGSVNDNYSSSDYEYIIDDKQSSNVNNFLSNLFESTDNQNKILQVSESGDGITFVETESLRGLQGPQGIQGPVGEQGIPGQQGQVGSQGIQGEHGIQGEQGIAGPQGDAGQKGEAGTSGEKGEQGNDFIFSDFTSEQLINLKGEKGNIGEQGIAGLQGDIGLKGDKGETAPRGIDGDVGDVGEKGERGEQGISGPQGDIGLKGEQGDAFVYSDFTTSQLESLVGEKGIQGIAGLQGDIGLKGDQGDQGADGIDGKSAYEIYSENTNFALPESDWLASLQGQVGVDGEKGDQGDSYFTQNGNNISYSAGNVGIGTTNSDAPLEVYDLDLNGHIAKFSDSSGTQLSIASGGNIGIGTTAQKNDLVIVASSNTNSTLSNDPPYIVIENTKSPYSNNNVFGGYVFSKTGSSNVHGSLSSGIRAGMYAVYNGATENQVSSNVGLSLRFQTSAQDAGNGNVRMVINGDGKVGMGILSPTQGLHVANGNIQCQRQIRATGWFAGSATDVEPACEIGMSNGKGYVMAYDRGNSSYKEIVLQSHHAYFNLKQDGKIGLNTTDPDTELHIMSSAHADASGQATIKLQSRKADGFSTGIIFSNSSETSNGAIFYHADNYMRFNVGGTGVSTERMRIDSTGAVIINSGVISSGAFGTISSGGTLVTVVPAVDNTRVFSLIGASNRSRGGAMGTVDIRTPQASDFPKGAISCGFTSWNLNNTNPYADYINFNTYTDSSGGNSTMMLVSKSSNGIKFSRLGFSVNTNYSLGSIYTVNVTSGSDASVKENVNEITNGLQKISELRPVTFHWTDEYIESGFSKNESENVYDENGERILPNQKITNVGLIAQEVEEVIPTVVHNDRISLSGTEDTIKNIDYDKIVPYLVASIKELKSQNDDLLNRIKSLEEK